MVMTSDNSSCRCALQYYQPAGNAGCIACHSSCVTCNGAGINNCTSCDSSPAIGTNRVLINGACQCVNKYYPESSEAYGCLPCHYSCMSCSGNSSNNCLSCSINSGRTLSGSTCVCRSGYTDNGQN